MPRLIYGLFLVALLPGQEQKFAYPLPPASDFLVTKDVPYRTWNNRDLLMDVYRPANLKPADRLPVLVLLNTISQSRRGDFYYTAWARVTAARGFIGIAFDIHDNGIEEDFDRLTSYLAGHATELNVDANQIAVWAASGIVSSGFPLVENPGRTAVKAAVILYGYADVKEFRADLPLLYVRAGLDRPGVNERIAAIASEAIRQNAPVTLLNYAGGHHAFELFDDNQATRDVIDRIFAFLKSAMSPAYQAALRTAIPEATAAAAVATSDFPKAAQLYATLAAARPSDPRIVLSFGEALLGARRYTEARVQFDRLKTMGGVGPRDLALPAAEACVLDGDPAAAVAWLKTIPKRFLPVSVKEDPAFAQLRYRPDFQELFR